ncbi:MAG: tyrosine-type recombinase/integrase [Coriobacteriales bacterium]|jgi:integrase/recombinase XerD|nr:tyrosine-type recombinase/integrase [Coriobacteriales bacterium]
MNTTSITNSETKLQTTGIPHEVIVAFFLSLAAERNLSAHTIRAYRRDAEAFNSWLNREEVNLIDVNHKHIRRYLSYLDRARYARSTISRHLSAIRAVFSWMERVGHISANPTKIISGPKKNRSLPRIVSQGDLNKALADDKLAADKLAADKLADDKLAADNKTLTNKKPLINNKSQADDIKHNAHPQTKEDKLASATKLRNHLLVELLYATGARISEMSRLSINDIQFAPAQLHLFGKGAKERIVPLHNLAIKCLSEYTSKARPVLLEAGATNEAIAATTDALFVSVRGKAMSADSLRVIFKKHMRDSGADPSVFPHAMRHTFATDLLEHGADLRSVQELLGHASLSSTQIYTHLSVSHLKDTHRRAHPRGANL